MVLGTWKLDNVEYENAVKSDALIQVNERVRQLIAEVDGCSGAEKVTVLNDHCR